MKRPRTFEEVVAAEDPEERARMNNGENTAKASNTLRMVWRC
jgi:hypothetical protein